MAYAIKIPSVIDICAKLYHRLTKGEKEIEARNKTRQSDEVYVVSEENFPLDELMLKLSYES